MAFTQRKSARLQGYDYSSNGAYFITICTHNREMLFGNVGADSISARLINDVFMKTIELYQTVHCNKFVIMPNHFHAILIIERADMESAPTLSKIVQTIFDG